MVARAGTRLRIFISSTIRDFGDLRDALRFWLEEMGFQVQLSEHTDFERKPETGTFEACFESIRNSDYYLLLIGFNRGSWYRQNQNLSVTREEYRQAISSFEATGSPRVIACVRSDVQVALRERRKTGSQSTESLLEDWSFTAEFIEEIQRADRAKEAAASETLQHPSSNWLAPFRDFRELVSILQNTLGVAAPLPKLALQESLRAECEHNLRILMRKVGGLPSYSHQFLSRVRREIELKPEQMEGLGAEIHLQFEHIRDIVMVMFGGHPDPSKFVSVALNQTITSGHLLEFDRTSASYTTTPLLDAVYRLRDAMESYRTRAPFLKEEAQQRAIASAWGRARANKTADRLPAMFMFALFAVDNDLENIVRLLVGILRHLYGHTRGIEMQLRPESPIARFQEEREKEDVSQAELRSWLEKDEFLLQLGLTDVTQEKREELDKMQTKLKEMIGVEEYDRISRERMETLMQDAREQARPRQFTDDGK